MKTKTRLCHKVILFIALFSLLLQQLSFAQMAGELNIAGHLSQIQAGLTQTRFRLPHLRYLSYDNTTNNIQLLLDKGDIKDISEAGLTESGKELLKYFLIGVTIPDENFWVNLRPDSKDNIIPDILARTEIGKIFLEADVQLKKDTAQFTSPQTPQGKLYWDKLYQKAAEIYGTQNVSIPTLTRPWIVPDEIIIREAQGSAYIYKATLKVMLEQDHLKGSVTYNFQDSRAKELNEYSSQLIRELIIPELTKEVNNAKRYAGLRQVYYSLILARWFKARFSQGLSPQGTVPELINKQNLANLTSKEPWSKDTYFKQYQDSFKNGEYNLQVPANTLGGPTIRTYFSGGLKFENMEFSQDKGKNVSPVATFKANNNQKLLAAATRLNSLILFTVIPGPAGANLQFMPAIVNNPVPTLPESFSSPAGAVEIEEGKFELRYSESGRGIPKASEKTLELLKQGNAQRWYELSVVVNNTSEPPFARLWYDSEKNQFIIEPTKDFKIDYYDEFSFWATRGNTEYKFISRLTDYFIEGNHDRTRITVIKEDAKGEINLLSFDKSLGLSGKLMEASSPAQVELHDLRMKLLVLVDNKPVSAPEYVYDFILYLVTWLKVKEKAEHVTAADFIGLTQMALATLDEPTEATIPESIKNGKNRDELIKELNERIPLFVKEMYRVGDFVDEVEQVCSVMASTLVPANNTIEKEYRDIADIFRELYGGLSDAGYSSITGLETALQEFSDKGYPDLPYQLTFYAKDKENKQLFLYRKSDKAFIETSAGAPIADAPLFTSSPVEEKTIASFQWDGSSSRQEFFVPGAITKGNSELIIYKDEKKVLTIYDLYGSGDMKLTSDYYKPKAEYKESVAQGDYWVWKCGAYNSYTEFYLPEMDIQYLRRDNKVRLIFGNGNNRTFGKYELKEKPVSSPVRVPQSSPILEQNPKETGGIDFRSLPLTIQPLGSFKDLSFILPPAEVLAQINISQELVQIKQMVDSGIAPSGERVKDLVAACYHKQELANRQHELMSCLMRICKLEEDMVVPLDASLKEAIVIVDAM